MSVLLHGICKRTLQSFNRRYLRNSTICYNHYDSIEEINKIIVSLGKQKEKLIYNSYIETQFKWQLIQKMEEDLNASKSKLDELGAIPIALKYYINNDDIIVEKQEKLGNDTVKPEYSINLPYGESSNLLTKVNEAGKFSPNEDVQNVEDEIRRRYNMQNDKNWMLDYENYDDMDLVNKKFYGTEDPYSRISTIPCGGCGAHLHCRDSSLPGYVPSEIYKNYDLRNNMELKSLLCQRCHFLKNYNLALQLRVSSEDYPKVLSTIRNYKKALVLLVVDLLDFPCSIWPGITDLIGYNRPILVVGNKIDLLQVDDKNFLKRIEDRLLTSLKENGFATTNIKGISLISAKTGFGIEDLINKLHKIWQYEGDVFLVGCTNVGKSSLFNILLQSDYCKSQATDLIQRATTSIWPGTTLNLLKFPILRPSKLRLYQRTMRLMKERENLSAEKKIRQSKLSSTKNRKYATLIGYVDKTFTNQELPPSEDSTDVFSLKPTRKHDTHTPFGIDEDDPKYALSKWCYDTPGVVHPDQITDLLTTDELIRVFPKEVIKPRTFRVAVGQSFFIAGLSRLDYLAGPGRIYFTLFCGSTLPLTLCETEVADSIYEKFIGTELFGVPLGKERLKLWPNLKAGKIIKCTGNGVKESCIDVVLSSSGWISITGESDVTYTFQGWTPDARGIHVRDSLLPKAVNLRGKPIRHTPTYRNNKFYKNTTLV